LSNLPVNVFDDYWLEYYKPLALSTFLKIFSWKISIRPRYLDDGRTHEIDWNPSPFIPRKQAQEPDSPGKRTRKGVTIVDPQSDDVRSIHSTMVEYPHSRAESMIGGKDLSVATFVPADKSQINQWTLKQWYDNMLNPSVTGTDEELYQAHIDYPLQIPLVTSTEEPETIENADFAEYLGRVEGDLLDDVTEDGDYGIADEKLADYAEFLSIAETANPLMVTEEDRGRKRFKAYRQWLKGKSFFKQSKVDPEFRTS